MYAGHSIAVILGDASDGLVVRDFDDMDAYALWQERFPGLASTLPTVATPRGRHVYFTADVADIYTSFGRKIVVYDDGELRAGNGYVLLPPSLHPSGQQYEWIIEPDDFPYVSDVIDAGLAHLEPQKVRKSRNETQCNRGGGGGVQGKQGRHGRKKDYKSRHPSKPAQCHDHRQPAKTTDGEGRACSLILPGQQVFSPRDISNLTIESAIQLSQPDSYGQRNHRIFQFCRLLKAWPR